MATIYRRNIVVGPKTWERLRALAKKEERSMSDILREAAITLLDQRDAGVTGGYDVKTDTFKRRDL